MSGRVSWLIGRVYDHLMVGTNQRTSNPKWSRSNVVDALNACQRNMELEMGYRGQGNRSSYHFAAPSGVTYVNLPLRAFVMKKLWGSNSDADRSRELDHVGVPGVDDYWVDGDDPMVLNFGDSNAANWFSYYLADLLLTGALMHTGTLGSQSGAATTELILPSSATEGEVFVDDDYYNDAWIYIETGTGAGQRRQVSDYDGDTRTITLSSAWTAPPVSGDTYCIETSIMSHFQEDLALGAAEYLRGLDESDSGGRMDYWMGRMRGKMGMYFAKKGNMFKFRKT